MLRPVLLAALALAACARPAPDTPPDNTLTSAGATDRAVANAALPTPTPSPSPSTAVAGPDEAAYLGRWIGVEGMVLDVTRNPAGGVRLDNQWDLDNRGTFDGSVTAEGLRFTRRGVAEIAVPSDGDATGLKWLAGKQRCLTVKPGEGYCRD